MVLAAPVSMKAIALIGTSYLEGSIWTSMLGAGGIDTRDCSSTFVI